MTTLTAVALTHRRVPLQLLERFPRGDEAHAVLESVRSLPRVRGCLVLSTCNRFEVYLTSDKAVRVEDVIAAVAPFVRGPGEWAHLCEHLTDDQAARHLFDVAAGLDSRLIGENEILGQVRAGAQAAAQAGCLDMELATLAQRAVRAGRRARRSLGSVGPRASVADHAVEVLDVLLGGVSGRRVLVLGAGALGARATRTLTSAGAVALVGARDVDKARAADVDASIVPMDLLPTLVGEVDAVVCATSAARPLVTASMLRDAVRAPHSPTLVILDLGVPRNAEADVARLPGVVYLDLDGLAARDGSAPHDDEHVLAAQRVVDSEVAAYATERAEREVAGLIRHVASHTQHVRDAELLRVSGRLSPSDLAIADELTRRVVSKLLHPVLTGIRAAAAAGELDAALAAARIFCGDGVESPEQRRHSQAS